MKKITPLLIALICYQTIFAQQTIYASNPFPQTISVTGSAAIDILPDEIYVEIQLMEYQKKGESKTELENIKSNFLGYCKDAGIPDSLISISSSSGTSNYYYLRRRKKDNNLFATITYQIKFNGTDLMDALIDRLDENATQKFMIVSVSHSRILEYRQQLKTAAIREAKRKAEYLAEAIGEKVGAAVSITEPNDQFISNYTANTVYNGFYKSEGDKMADYSVDFKKIRLKYDINAVFALK